VNEGPSEPVRCLFHFLAPFDFSTPFAIENKYCTCVESEEATQAVEEGAHFRIFAGIVMVVAEDSRALHQPYTALTCQ
jgi:hypothetical protein